VVFLKSDKSDTSIDIKVTDICNLYSSAINSNISLVVLICLPFGNLIIASILSVTSSGACWLSSTLISPVTPSITICALLPDPSLFPTKICWSSPWILDSIKN